MNSRYFIFGGIIIVLGGIGFFLFQNTSFQKNVSLDNSTQAEEVVKQQMTEGYQGNVLAGRVTPYLEFNEGDYQKAISDGKVVFLNFYADWCPICRAEQPELFEGFNELDLENVVGFQVNFKDAKTDETEKALAQQFQIPYQHTKVILVNGSEVFKETVQWDGEDLVETLSQYTNQ